MSDNTESDSDSAEIGAEMPEMQTFRVSVVRQFEMDLSERQVETLLKQSDEDTEEDAVEELFTEQEKQFVEPEQKLIGVRAQVETQ